MKTFALSVRLYCAVRAARPLVEPSPNAAPIFGFSDHLSLSVRSAASRTSPTVVSDLKTPEPDLGKTRAMTPREGRCVFGSSSAKCHLSPPDRGDQPSSPKPRTRP